MITWPHSNRLLLAVGACALTFSVAACSDVSPENIPPNANTGPGNQFSPGSGGGADQIGGGANSGFPSNGGGNGPNAPGH